MQCPNCEAENREEAKFCDECGFPLSGSIARVAGAASPKGAETHEARRREPVEHVSIDEAPWVIDSIDEPVYDEFARSDSPEELDQLNAPSPSYSTFEDDMPDDFSYDAFDIDDLPMSQDDYEQMEQAYQEAPERPTRELAYDDLGFGDGTQPLSGYISGDAGWSGEHTMEMPLVDPKQHASKSRDFRVGPDARKGNGKLLAFIVAGVAVGAIIAALVTFALGFWGGIAVPDVTGMTEADAQSALISEGFTVRTTQVKSDDTEGLVLIMDPGAGSRAPEGSEVVIHVATARYIPDIVGKDLEQAKAMLEETGYENVRYEMQKSDEDENIVLDVSPQTGSRAISSTEVIVKVSEAYRVPDVSGMSPEEAVAAVSDAGLEPEVVYIDTDQFPDGSIIGTNPEPNTKVDAGTTVSISVVRARGIELVNLTEQMLSEGNTVTVGGVDYDIESVVSVSYQGDDTVAFTATGRPKITFFGETLYASSSQTVSGQVIWSEDNEVVSIV